MLNASKTNKTNQKEKGGQVSRQNYIWRQTASTADHQNVYRRGGYTQHKTSLINNSSLMHSTFIQASLLGYRDINIKDSFGE